MSEKDKANPAQRLTMEERWRKAREACEAGICDPTEKKFHRSGCMRRISGDTIIVRRLGEDGQPVGEPVVSHGKVTVEVLGEWVSTGNGEGVLDLSNELAVRGIASWPNSDAADVPPHIRNFLEEASVDINERTNDRLRKDDGPEFIPPGLVKFDTEGVHPADDPEIWGAPVDHTNARGWCAPSRCAVGICAEGEAHDLDCRGPGHAYQMMNGADFGEGLLSLPELKVERGGMFIPQVKLTHEIKPVKDHWWSRTRYEVWSRPNGSASPRVYMGWFRSYALAKEQCGDLDKLNYEINRSIKRVNDAAR